MNRTFYTNIVKTFIQKLLTDRDYYLANSKDIGFTGDAREAYRLLALLYDALAVEAQKHLADHQS